MLKTINGLTKERLAKGGPGSGRHPKEKPEHPAHYFQGSKERVAELQGRASDSGLIDIENEDLTPHGLKAKMWEWDEGEHGVPSDIYDRTEAQLKESGETMPEGIRRLSKMAKGGPGSGRHPERVSSEGETYKIQGGTATFFGSGIKGKYPIFKEKEVKEFIQGWYEMNGEKIDRGTARSLMREPEYMRHRPKAYG